MVLYSSNTGAVCGNFYVKWLISCAATHWIKKITQFGIKMSLNIWTILKTQKGDLYDRAV